MKSALSVSCLLLLVACAVPELRVSSGCRLGERYIDAANHSDASRIADWIRPDVEVIFLADEPGKHESIEGKDAVLEAIETYTQQCTSCRSTPICLHENDSAQYLVERVRFLDQDGIERVQSAPLVLELQDGDIRRVIYYPATRQPD